MRSFPWFYYVHIVIVDILEHCLLLYIQLVRGGAVCHIFICVYIFSSRVVGILLGNYIVLKCIYSSPSVLY